MFEIKAPNIYFKTKEEVDYFKGLSYIELKSVNEVYDCTGSIALESTTEDGDLIKCWYRVTRYNNVKKCDETIQFSRDILVGNYNLINIEAFTSKVNYMLY